MASIGPVKLEIIDQPSGTVRVQLSYRIFATHHDAEHEQAYREVVELIGVDTGEPGEDGVDDILPGGKISDGIVVFTTSETSIDRLPELPNLPAGVLDEDSHPFLPLSDEIRARVTLTPLPPIAPSRESNLVRREQIVGPIA